MRHKVVWVAILLVVAALAGPAAAAPPSGTGSVFGEIFDSAPNVPFDLNDGSLIGVDVFNLGTMKRTVVWISGGDPSQYDFASLAAGDYKMRFRYEDHKGNLSRYRWYGNAGNFDTASPFTVQAGKALRLDFTLRPTAGAAVSGTMVERGTGLPLSGCVFAELFEASGISLGLITWPDASGAWSLPMIPAGRYAVLGYVLSDPADPGCKAPPSHLDTWRGGASGYPLRHANLVADAHTFSTAGTFRVRDGVDVTGLTIQMLRAPLCRGQVPTIFGTTLDDVINGTSGRDIISGLAGNDKLYGRGGNDLICGDAGNDLIRGGVGTDIAVGGPGTDDCDAEHTPSCSP